jgi:hypothetical protein
MAFPKRIILPVLWGAVALAFIVSPVWSWAVEDEGVLSSMPFGVLVASVPANLSILVAAVFRIPSKKISKAIWLGLALAALLLFALTAGGQDVAATESAGAVMGYIMMTLSFPLGLFGVGIFAMAGEASSINASPPYILNVLLWLLLVALGYSQWFLVLPRIMKRALKHRDNQS